MKKIKYLIKEYLTIRNQWETHHTGIGYKTGNGFDLYFKRFSVGMQPHRWISIITDVRFDHETPRPNQIQARDDSSV